MKQFFQTDPDTRQFCRALSPTTYQFTDIVPFHSKSACPLSRIDGQKNIRYNGKERGQRKWKTNAKKG